MIQGWQIYPLFLSLFFLNGFISVSLLSITGLTPLCNRKVVQAPHEPSTSAGRLTLPLWACIEKCWGMHGVALRAEPGGMRHGGWRDGHLQSNSSIAGGENCLPALPLEHYGKTKLCWNYKHVVKWDVECTPSALVCFVLLWWNTDLLGADF